MCNHLYSMLWISQKESHALEIIQIQHNSQREFTGLQLCSLGCLPASLQGSSRGQVSVSLLVEQHTSALPACSSVGFEPGLGGVATLPASRARRPAGVLLAPGRSEPRGEGECLQSRSVRRRELMQCRLHAVFAQLSFVCLQEWSYSCDFLQSEVLHTC